MLAPLMSWRRKHFERFHSLDQRPPVVRQHVRQEHAFERKQPTLNRRDLSLHPISQDRVDGDNALRDGVAFPIRARRAPLR